MYGPPDRQSRPNPSATRIQGTMMSLAADSNTATRTDDLAAGSAAGSLTQPPEPDETVEHALAAAVKDATRIGDLLDVLRSARLWLPLTDDGKPVITGGAVTLPTVSYLGSEFVPAYSSADLLQQFARPAAAEQPPTDPSVPVPHAVVRAADLARLLPPSIGIALNAGATESVPVYPQGVSYLAAERAGDDAELISVGPLPVRPDALLAGIAAGLLAIPAVRAAAAGWLTVQFAGEGLLVSVSLDDPADAAARDLVIGTVERAAWEVEPQQAGFPIDITFPGERQPDRIDDLIAAAATPFYRRS
jgi:SseB protein N-terminal domain